VVLATNMNDIQFLDSGLMLLKNSSQQMCKGTLFYDLSFNKLICGGILSHKICVLSKNVNLMKRGKLINMKCHTVSS